MFTLYHAIKIIDWKNKRKADNEERVTQPVAQKANNYKQAFEFEN